MILIMERRSWLKYPYICQTFIQTIQFSWPCMGWLQICACCEKVVYSSNCRNYGGGAIKGRLSSYCPIVGNIDGYALLSAVLSPLNKYARATQSTGCGGIVQFVACSVQCAVQYAVCNMRCAVCSVQKAVCSMHICSVQCTAQSSLCSFVSFVQCSVADTYWRHLTH